ncbi:hydrolase 1, exosortase A system-associated [Neptunomonas qingdaonensis]|uniref:Exosortase A system-associated hydrolase 1/exosortase A system-associated hydrolase 2 n=1 Tax=Neptunomonas qingdaonensis TaxID=1045558 RepID=A0A1I2MVA7_9GAMM|nr:hydrolase 1, exosortase A system-associated [Neptunomonas qingdaonensis]SFF94840.1 exosortase A system-associated hydrolase 1/exosortase A system-associated hydrolase 2 [Neptunomonas qingdaonensis]
MMPQFVSGPAGQLFITLYSSKNTGLSDEWVIHLPAFAEEMNKSRKIVRDQAVALADKGATVIVPDLFGTGDSEGDFGQADWDIWKQDVRFLIQWAVHQGARLVTLWGLRAGALLALDLYQDSALSIHRLLLWQPFHSGEQLMTQFLRLRMAAGILSGEPQTVTQLRERLYGGETIEVAGYDVSPALVKQLDQINLKQFTFPSNANIDWFEVVNKVDKPLLPVSRKLIEELLAQGLDVRATTIEGEPFWATQELVRAPLLIERTTNAIAEVNSRLSSQLVSPSCNKDHPEQTFLFDCKGDLLSGILHPGGSDVKTGVLIVVGGPQYRVGSHRQFVHLSRALAAQGLPVMRFDYRGMGDSSGELLGFEHIQADIRSAIDAFINKQPEIHHVVIWGLCDAATAAGFYAEQDERVAGLVLLNPWVRSEEGEAKAYLKHYYLQRLISKQFWQKVVSGDLNVGDSIASLVDKVQQVAGKVESQSVNQPVSESENQTSMLANAAAGITPSSVNLAEKLQASLKAYQGPVLLIISGKDLTAAEFDDAVNASRPFRKLLSQKRFSRVDLKSADHTFSRREWRDEVAVWTVNWVQKL